MKTDSANEEQNPSSATSESPLTALASPLDCKECHPYHTTKGPRHAVTCPTLTDTERMEWWKARYYEIDQSIRKTQSRHNLAATKWHEQITFWQGKFAAVKHENNKLRRKLYPSKSEATALAEGNQP